MSRRRFLQATGLTIASATLAYARLGCAATRAAYLKAVRPLLPDAEVVYFAGKMDFARLSFLDRAIAKMVKAVESDQRDWDAIRRWAETVSIN